MGNEVFNLAILLTLKDLASGPIGRSEAQLRSWVVKQIDAGNFRKPRSSMKRDFMIAGVGVASLALMKKGVDVAADFESSYWIFAVPTRSRPLPAPLSAQEQETH